MRCQARPSWWSTRTSAGRVRRLSRRRTACNKLPAITHRASSRTRPPRPRRRGHRASAAHRAHRRLWACRLSSRSGFCRLKPWGLHGRASISLHFLCIDSTSVWPCELCHAHCTTASLNQGSVACACVLEMVQTIYRPGRPLRACHETGHKS